MFMDPAEKYPVGSTEWSGRISVRVYLEYERAEFCGFKPLVGELRKAVLGRPRSPGAPPTAGRGS
jgi:hypothetical protein